MKFIRPEGSNLFDYQATDVLFCASLFISMQDIQHRVFWEMGIGLSLKRSGALQKQKNKFMA